MVHIHRTAIIAGLTAMLLPFVTPAQTGDLLKSGQPRSAEILTRAGALLPGHAPVAGNIGNIAGVLEYCIRNKFLQDDNALSVEESLKEKLDKGPLASDGYRDGVQGILHDDSGKPTRLGGSGLPAAATQQICNTVLSAAKSMF